MEQEDLKKDIIVRLKNSSNDYFYKVVQCDEWPLSVMDLKTKLTREMSIGDIEPWRPTMGDKVIRILNSGRYSNPIKVIHTNHAKDMYVLKGFSGTFKLKQLEPYIEQDKVRTKEIAGESSGVKVGKLKYKKGDIVLVESIGDGSNTCKHAGYLLQIKGFCKHTETGRKIYEADIETIFRGMLVDLQPGRTCWFTDMDVIGKPEKKNPEPKEKCGCEGSGFLNADQIPADVFIEGTEAIVGWIEETNAPFEDSGCSCHCGNPPCSYCTDSTLAEVCSCNSFADDFKGQDPLGGKTYSDVVMSFGSGSESKRVAMMLEQEREIGNAQAFDDFHCEEHEDSLDKHGEFMRDLIEQSRKDFGGRNKILGHQ